MPTTVLNPTKWAVITGNASDATLNAFSIAREGDNGGSVVNNPSSDDADAIFYKATSGRGNTAHQFARTFYYFDVSGVANLASLSTASLDINGVTNADSKVIIVSSSAFGGDGSSNAVFSDFFDSLDYSQPYSDTNGQQWTVGANSFDLEQGYGGTYLKTSPDAFIFAIIDYNNDYGSTAGTPTIENLEGVKFSDHASGVELTLVTAATTTIDNINGVAYNANARFNGVLLSDIGNINGVP